MSLTPQQLSCLDGLSIELKPCTLPAFVGADITSCYYLNAKAVIEDNIQEITVTPVIHGATIGTSGYLKVDCYFPEEEPNFHQRYGLVYGDDRFEYELDAHVRRVLGDLGNKTLISYTEQGMQGDDYISLEGGENFIAFVTGMSKHALLALSRNDQISSITMKDFTWPRPQEQ